MDLPIPLGLVHWRWSARFLLAGLAAITLTLIDIGGPAPAAAADTVSGRWEELRGDDLRVASVSYRLSIANKGLCRGALAPQLGFVLHSIEQYGSVDRKEAARSFGLGAHVGAMAVVENSPAMAAGLRPDDQLVSVNGRELGPTGTGTGTAAPTIARLEASRQLIVAEMKKGEVSLHLSGPGGDREVRFTADLGCPSNVELVPGGAANAWADGQAVVVSAGLLKECRTDDDLAVAIAHEMAHNLLRHSARLARSGVSRRGLLLTSGPGSAEMRETEEEADRLAVHLAMAAGYDLSGAVAFLSGLQRRSGIDRSPSTHPVPARRLALLTAAIAAARRASAPTSPASDRSQHFD